jgi:tRNA-specific 2-thiouridylase
VYVEQGTLHPSLYCDELTAVEASWVSGVPVSLPFNCKAKVRYRQQDQECTILKNENGVLHVRFAIPQRAVTQRQSIVFYDGDICLGGAMIQKAGPSYYHQDRPLPSTLGL